VVIPPGEDEDANLSRLEERNRHLRQATLGTEKNDCQLQQDYRFG
jgi:hypothetical protein